MSPYSSMAEAMRMTRAGNLAEATALLRTTLGGGGSPVRQAAATKVIDLVPERVTITAKHNSSELRPAPLAGRFEARRHAGSAGVIDYMFYLPCRATAGMPIVVMLHGCTQSPEDFARGTAMNKLGDELGFFVAYPRQTETANPQRCWNWFRPGDQRHGRGEPALIAGLTRDAVAAESVDVTRVYVAGFSAGGAAAAIMAEAYPDLFAAVGIHSGVACGAARDLPSALTAMKQGGARGGVVRVVGARFVPVITFHGDRDQVVHEANARDIVRAATAATGTPVAVEVQTGDAGGRRYTRALSRDDAGQVLIEPVDDRRCRPRLVRR